MLCVALQSSGPGSPKSPPFPLEVNLGSLREMPSTWSHIGARLSHTQPGSNRLVLKIHIQEGLDSRVIPSADLFPSLPSCQVRTSLSSQKGQGQCVSLSLQGHLHPRLSTPGSFTHPRFQRYQPSLTGTMGFLGPKLHTFYMLIRVNGFLSQVPTLLWGKCGASRA